MAEVTINGSALGNGLQALLVAPDILPGDGPSYELCKQIYAYHPLGAKMTDAPISAAQSQPRQITVPKSPEDLVRDAFLKQWEADGCDRHIFNAARTARQYGISSIAVLTDGKEPGEALDFTTLWRDKIGFNVLDPLNTAGSLVLNQDPNSIDFQKHASIAVGGKRYHRSRSVTVLNEDPLYIEYTTSAFGFVGRSVYQRALYPLKSFINTMVTDDMVSKKAGLLIAFIKGAGSIVDNLMARFQGIKRSLLKMAVVDNVLSMGPDDKVESLNLQNLDGAFGNSRTNILKNIATAADMPAVMLENETLTEGFGEGTEDAKIIARYINRIRIWMAPLYAFMDPIVQARAWNPDFYKTIQAQFPDEYGAMSHKEAFYQWQTSFSALWPSLLEEPESEKIKVDDVKLKAGIALLEVLMPELDPENRATAIQWACDTFNGLKLLFPSPLILDTEALASYTPAKPLEEPHEPKPFAATDSAIARLDEAVARLPNRKAPERVLARA
jgi:Anti-CBASS Acb1-like protein